MILPQGAEVLLQEFNHIVRGVIAWRHINLKLIVCPPSLLWVPFLQEALLKRRNELPIIDILSMLIEIVEEAVVLEASLTGLLGILAGDSAANVDVVQTVLFIHVTNDSVVVSIRLLNDLPRLAQDEGCFSAVDSLGDIVVDGTCFIAEIRQIFFL